MRKYILHFLGYMFGCESRERERCTYFKYEIVILSLKFARECNFSELAKSVAFVTLVAKTRKMQRAAV